jgi:hypothetical protein
VEQILPLKTGDWIWAIATRPILDWPPPKGDLRIDLEDALHLFLDHSQMLTKS